MKGLLYKDGYLTWKYGKSILLFTLIWMVMMVWTDSLFWGIFPFLFAVMNTRMTFSYDEQTKWNSFLVTMPVSRKQMAEEKYLLVFLNIAAIAVLEIMIGLAAALFSKEVWLTADTLLILGTGIGAAFLYSAIELPMIFRLGLERSRIWLFGMTILVFALVGGGAAITQSAFLSESGMVQNEGAFYTAIVSVLAVGIAAYVISLFISARIMESKEF